MVRHGRRILKRILGFIAVAVTLLTMVSLIIDVPEKIKSSYEKIFRVAPDVKINALFANQEAIYLSSFTDDKSKGFNHFVWPSVFEIHNFGDKDITILHIENINSEVHVSEHVLQLKQIYDSDSVVVVYDSFQQLTSSDEKSEKGIVERLPYTIKSGSKKYIKLYAYYIVTDGGSTLFCKDKESCYRLLLLSLGIATKNGEEFPCPLANFQSKIDFSKYESKITDQRAILLVVDCKLHLDKLNDLINRYL